MEEPFINLLNSVCWHKSEVTPLSMDLYSVSEGRAWLVPLSSSTGAAGQAIALLYQGLEREL